MTVTQRVENILRVSKDARNSDKELLIIYMQKSGMNLTPEQVEIFKNLPAMETIRRVRQNLQEQGKYPASPEVEQQRYEKYKNVKQNISGSSTSEVERVVAGDKEYRVKEWGEY